MLLFNNVSRPRHTQFPNNLTLQNPLLFPGCYQRYLVAYFPCFKKCMWCVGHARKARCTVGCTLQKRRCRATNRVTIVDDVVDLLILSWWVPRRRQIRVAALYIMSEQRWHPAQIQSCESFCVVGMHVCDTAQCMFPFQGERSEWSGYLQRLCTDRRRH